MHYHVPLSPSSAFIISKAPLVDLFRDHTFLIPQDLEKAIVKKLIFFFIPHAYPNFEKYTLFILLGSSENLTRKSKFLFKDM